MAIRLKRNFRRFYYKKFLRSKIKKFNKFLLHRRKKLASSKLSKFSRRFKKGRKVFKKKLRLSKIYRALFIKSLYVAGYRKRYFFYYLRSTLDAIRIKKILAKYKYRIRKKIWRKLYKTSFKRFYFNFFKRSAMLKVRHFRLVSRFYKRLGFRVFLKKFLKYARLKAILKRYGKLFREKKKENCEEGKQR